MNLPNALAFLRVLMAPLMLFFLIERDLPIFDGWDSSWLDYFAALVFVIASITDFFDGYIARKWNQMTKLGSIIDPLADKMLVFAGFLGLMVLDRANAWIIFLILSREFFIMGLRVVSVSDGVDVAASFAGKVKTVVQMIAIGFLTMKWQYGDIILWIALFLTLYSGVEYVRAYFKSIKK